MARASKPLLLALLLSAVLLVLTSPSHYASADSQALPHLEIDADPTNGSRPCHPIDATRSVAANTGYDVAVCLDESGGAPDAFEVTVIWAGPVTAVDATDVGDAIDDNPDFNQAPAPYGNGTNWSCNTFGVAYPLVGPPAHIACNEKNLAAGPLTDNPGLLAVLHLSANGVGQASFSLTTDGSSSLNSPVGSNRICGQAVQCPGATVTHIAPGVDSDGDNCEDVRELGLNHVTGGERDMSSPWDFFDVPVPASGVGTDGRPILSPTASRNRAITLSDVSAILAYVGRTSSGAEYAADHNLDGILDGHELDRTASVVPNQPWRSGPPNGAITLSDVSVGLAQVGDNCA